MDEVKQPNQNEQALTRVKAALSRIEAAADKVSQLPSDNDGSAENSSASSAKVMALVNQHEAMREEVAVTMRELDSIISKLEM